MVSRAHHGRENELFDPKFCAEGPRDWGAPLNSPKEGTFFSTAAFLWDTKNLRLLHSQDQRRPSPLIGLALLQVRGTAARRNDQFRANALCESYHAGPWANRNRKKHLLYPLWIQFLFLAGTRGCLWPPQTHSGGHSVLFEAEKYANGPLVARAPPQQFFWDRPEPGTGTSQIAAHHK